MVMFDIPFSQVHFDRTGLWQRLKKVSPLFQDRTCFFSFFSFFSFFFFSVLLMYTTVYTVQFFFPARGRMSKKNMFYTFFFFFHFISFYPTVERIIR